MNKETVQDEFYKSGPDPVPTKPKRESRRRSSGAGEFDVTKKGRARSKNRGARRVMRRLRRYQDFRMKLLWIIASGVVLSILVYAAMEHMKWSRIENLPEDQRAAAMEKMIEKNRQK